jgi:hypothetical protein
MNAMTQDLGDALAVGERQRPGAVRDTDLIIAIIQTVAERRPEIGGRFIAHTAVMYAEAHRPDEDAATLAGLVIAEWEAEVADARDIDGSAGV